MKLPADVVEELGQDISARPQIVLMRATQRPTIIIDRIELRIGGFEKGDAVFISRRIVGEPRAGDAVRVAGGGWRRSPPHYRETDDRPDVARPIISPSPSNDGSGFIAAARHHHLNV